MSKLDYNDMVLPEHALSCFFGRVELPLSDVQFLFQWRWNTFVVMQQHGFRDDIDGGSVKHFGPDINIQPHRAASTTVDALSCMLLWTFPLPLIQLFHTGFLPQVSGCTVSMILMKTVNYMYLNSYLIKQHFTQTLSQTVTVKYFFI